MHFWNEEREENVAKETKSEKEGCGQSHTTRAPGGATASALQRSATTPTVIFVCAHLDAEAALAPGSVRHDFSRPSKEKNSTAWLISLSISAFRRLALLLRRGGRFRKR
jgi:hypothetical protein